MRLTNAMRDSVVEEELVLKFNKALNDAEQDIIVQLEKEVKEKFCQEYIPKKMIDDGWVSTSCEVSVTFPGDKYAKSFSLNKSFPIKAHTKFQILASEQLLSLKKMQTDLESQKYKFKSDMRRIMYSFTTVKQITENIPEVAHYFKDEMKAASMALIPHEQIQDFRKQLSRFDITKKKGKS